MIRRLRHRRRTRGQALVEYVLALGLAAGIAVAVERLAKNGIRSVWRRMAADVAAACPPSAGCYRPDAIPEP
jgi:hypothetical protein